MKKKYMVILAVMMLAMAMPMTVSAKHDDGSVAFAIKHMKAGTYGQDFVGDVMADIRKDLCTPAQVQRMVDAGCLTEYIPELVSRGYLPATYVGEEPAPVPAPADSTAQASTQNEFSCVFNAKYYQMNYTDLEHMTDEELLAHFLNVGVNEGRVASKDFNINVYKNYNPDLVAAYGNANYCYLTHYITMGKAEGRKAVQ